ncbi:Hypothetical predicted protein [Cloeon dipterum]|uniref:Uncharacterized protein n=1 Tax=Cloeon dipterum TaxID=197152 RepID=A0A8S1DMJ4_9INSE|nr:Hypothetical predicted protein [Cloeon dipterum]
MDASTMSTVSLDSIEFIVDPSLDMSDRTSLYLSSHEDNDADERISESDMSVDASDASSVLMDANALFNIPEPLDISVRISLWLNDHDDADAQRPSESEALVEVRDHSSSGYYSDTNSLFDTSDHTSWYLSSHDSDDADETTMSEEPMRQSASSFCSEERPAKRRRTEP